MRICIWTVGTLLMNLGCAHATTYQFSYAGRQLTQAQGFLPVHGAKHVVFIVQSPSPFPKKSCFDVPLTSVTYLSDGHDTLETLAAAGYSNDNYSVLSLCTDETGKHVVSWSGGYEFEKNSGNPTKPDNFDIYSYSSPPKGTTYYDFVAFYIAKKRNGPDGYKTYGDYNTISSGTWKWKMLDH